MSASPPEEIYPDLITREDIFNGRPASSDQLGRLNNIASYFTSERAQVGNSRWFQYFYYWPTGTYVLTRGSNKGIEKVIFKPMRLNCDDDDQEFDFIVRDHPGPYEVTWRPADFDPDHQSMETSSGRITLDDLWFGDTKMTCDPENNLIPVIFEETIEFVDGRINKLMDDFMGAIIKSERPSITKRMGSAVVNGLIARPIKPGWL